MVESVFFWCGLIVKIVWLVAPYNNAGHDHQSG